MTYRYDFAGRLVSVRSPLDTLATPTLVHQYHPAGYYHNGIGPAGYAYSPSPSGHPYSVSLHYDDGGGLVTATAVLSNGFGRPVQSKKGLRTGGSDMMLVSGRTVADAFGRTVQQYDPVVEPVATHIGLYNTNFDPLSLATTSYDILDRVTETRLPLGVTTSSAYSIDADQQGRNCFLFELRPPDSETDRGARRVLYDVAVGEDYYGEGAEAAAEIAWCGEDGKELYRQRIELFGAAAAEGGNENGA